MREILFRGKRINSMKAGEWVEGFFMEWLNPCKNRKEARIQTISEGGCIDLIHEVDPSTVGQYTGLKDKNGRRIFEGDIVKCKGEGRICKVGYYTSPAYCGYDLYAVGNLKALPPHSWEFLDGLEVIGNIHDNPELMEER